jgi:hypothetical protein
MLLLHYKFCEQLCTTKIDGMFILLYTETTGTDEDDRLYLFGGYDQ